MASGWAPDGDVGAQIEDTVRDGVSRARAGLAGGPGRMECAECGEAIPEARRLAVPGVRRCVACQRGADGARAPAGINRRGSKDSQLK